jgi:hypothetical protein
MEKNLGKPVSNADSARPDASSHTRHLSSVLTERQIIQHLKQCRDLTRGHAYSLFSQFWPLWGRQLLEQAENANTQNERAKLQETHTLLNAVQQAAEHEFSQHLGNGFVKFKNNSLNTLTGEERLNNSLLPVQPPELEETIAISSITHHANAQYSEYLWALNQRLALLNDGKKIDERSNPVSPVQFCDALRRVLLSLDVDAHTKKLGYTIFEAEVIAQLALLYNELNHYLIAQQLLPNLQAAGGVLTETFTNASTEAFAEASEARASNYTNGAAETDESRRRRASDKLLNGELSPGDVQYQASLFNAIRLLQAHLSHANGDLPEQSTTGGAGQQDSDVINEPVIEKVLTDPEQELTNNQLAEVLQALQTRAFLVSQQAQSLDGELPSQSVEDISQQVLQQAFKQENGSLTPVNMHTIDLVGMLFSYMLSDEHLPDSVKTLLSYLHTPFLKMAVIDQSFLEQPEHPARMLLNSLVEAGVRWVGNDGSQQHDIYTKIKATVFRLLEEFRNDVHLFAQLLAEFNAYTANVVRRQESMEHRALEKMQGEEKLREAKMQVNQEVRRRTDDREIPSAVLLLLLQPWSDYLSFVLLRYGDQSSHWLRGLEVIEQVLWSIEPKTLQADKDRQIDIHASLLASLERGFETIGYEQAKGHKLIEALLSLQKIALQNRRAEPAPTPMRAKLESMAAEKAGQSLDGNEAITHEEAELVESLKLIEFGTWFEIDGGKRLKVVWYNKKTQHYMLIDQQGRRVSLYSGLHLAREMISGRAKMIVGSTKPFFERALENIYQTLNERATNARQGSQKNE